MGNSFNSFHVWWKIDVLSITYHSGMDYYTQNMGGKYHDDFYTNQDIIDAYKAYIEHVLNRKNSLTGKAYKVSNSVIKKSMKHADMSIHFLSTTRTILLFLAGNWQMSLVVKEEAACKSHQSVIRTPSPNGRMILARTSSPLTKTISWLLAMKVSSMMPPRASKEILKQHGQRLLYSSISCSWAYNGGSGIDFDALIALKNIDFGTFHLYPDSWNENPDSWATKWIKVKITLIVLYGCILIVCQKQDHISSQNDAGKPVIMEEYGVSADLRASVYPSWQKTVEDGDLAADAFWQLAVPCNPDLDEFALCSSDDDFGTIIGEHASAMASKVSINASVDLCTRRMAINF